MVNTVYYSLAQYLQPLLTKRLVSAASYWQGRLEAHQESPHSGVFLEASWWVNHLGEIRQQLSLAQIAEILQKIPEREVLVMRERSQGRRCKDVAQQLGVNIALVKTLYGRGLKRCISYLLDSIRPEPLVLESYKPAGQTAVVTPGLPDLTQPVWQAAEMVLRQRLGKGTRVVLGRLQAELVQVEPNQLDIQIEQWLNLHFSQVVGLQFRQLLEADKPRG